MLCTLLSHLPAHWLCVHALKNNVGSRTLRLIYKAKKKKRKTESDSILSAKLTSVKKLHVNATRVWGLSQFSCYTVSSHLVLCFGNGSQFADKKVWSVKWLLLNLFLQHTHHPPFQIWSGAISLRQTEIRRSPMLTRSQIWEKKKKNHRHNCFVHLFTMK